MYKWHPIILYEKDPQAQFIALIKTVTTYAGQTPGDNTHGLYILWRTGYQSLSVMSAWEASNYFKTPKLGAKWKNRRYHHGLHVFADGKLRALAFGMKFRGLYHYQENML